MSKEMEFSEWVKIGIENGWCGPPICYTHDGFPMSESESEEFESGDPCVHMVRLYEDHDQKVGVEEAHSPSQWRNHYTK